jgi:hypothetical protein
MPTPKDRIALLNALQELRVSLMDSSLVLRARINTGRLDHDRESAVLAQISLYETLAILTYALVPFAVGSATEDELAGF